MRPSPLSRSLLDPDDAVAVQRPEEEAAAIRAACREGRFSGSTAGVASGMVQGHFVALPKSLAGEFLRFCVGNGASLPVLAVAEPGDPSPQGLGADIDLRTDLPRYQIWNYGAPAREATDILADWREDLVAFVLGSVLSLRGALAEAGIAIGQGTSVPPLPRYRTNRPCLAAGAFSGPGVVTMLPLKATAAIAAIQISARFPIAHGAPVHLGDPALIGIADLARPDYGAASALPEDTLPVFWPSALTAHAVLAATRPPFCITGTAGGPLITGLHAGRPGAS